MENQISINYTSANIKHQTTNPLEALQQRMQTLKQDNPCIRPPEGRWMVLTKQHGKP